jgi:tRNA (mo5U34)-methyltransferase
VRDIRWYHRMELPGGITTDGISHTTRGLPRLQLPASFAGKSVLDIGAWDGFYSFEAARRGARRVLATDSFAWSGESWGSKDGFILARSLLGLENVVDDLTIDAMDISADRLGGRFDVVFFLGILYHLKDPIGALERAASVCGDLLIMETETALNWLPHAAARIFPADELGQDPTNWFSFNHRALRGLLLGLGFTRLEVKYRSPVARRVGAAARSAAHGRSFRSALRSSRVVIHAAR